MKTWWVKYFVFLVKSVKKPRLSNYRFILKAENGKKKKKKKKEIIV